MTFQPITESAQNPMMAHHKLVSDCEREEAEWDPPSTHHPHNHTPKNSQMTSLGAVISLFSSLISVF